MFDSTIDDYDVYKVNVIYSSQCVYLYNTLLARNVLRILSNWELFGLFKRINMSVKYHGDSLNNVELMYLLFLRMYGCIRSLHIIDLFVSPGNVLSIQAKGKCNIYCSNLLFENRFGYSNIINYL